MRLHVKQCYPVAEALYHVLGGRAAGWTPQVVKIRGGTHWYLRHRSGFILDPTATQFHDAVNYAKGRGCGFLTKAPSKRACVLIRQLKSRL